MKLDMEYIQDNITEINKYIYCYCLSDQVFQNSRVKMNCYNSFIYKFTKNQELVVEYRVIDVNKEYRYKEDTIKVDDDSFAYFKIIGDLFDLINYLEQDKDLEGNEYD